MKMHIREWKHKKRGTIYTSLTHDAIIQISGDIKDGDKVTVYMAIGEEELGPHEQAQMWVRKTDEFLDGRFEDLRETVKKELENEIDPC